MSFHALPVSQAGESETKAKRRAYSIGAAPLAPEAPWK
jgi:hypothetical protein